MTVNRKRCAIYTRKSSEEGLQQEFNSLDAQTESCAAYILSQSGEGWERVNNIYSDGGISGGHMDRAGLQALISDIQAGKADIVVVYKVDRLTRSLADFAKLVDVFDAHEVSFVSITQAFNTTTSMGRLTLNVLLSFAQFEREVTAERIRDKIAASKKRGKWMGGLPPLGYDNIDTKLAINESEAHTIKTIFSSYLEFGSVAALKTRLDKKGIVTKKRQTTKQGQCGGRPFSRGHLYKLLRNPVYIGKVRHKENIYEGEHSAILDDEVWDAVQTKLDLNAPKRKHGHTLQSGSLLTGLIYDESGDRLTPVHTTKSGRRYRYYISSRLSRGEMDDGKAWRLSAQRIEAQVISKLTDFLKDPTHLMKTISSQSQMSVGITKLTDASNQFTEALQSPKPSDRREAIIALVDRIELHASKLTIEVKKQALDTAGTNDTGDSITLEYGLTLKRKGVETRLIIGGQPCNTPDPKLITAIAKSRRWYDQLKSGQRRSLKEIAQHESIHTADVSRALPLAFLSPKIISLILKGEQSIDLTVDVLKRRAAQLPMAWDQQETYLGFAR